MAFRLLLSPLSSWGMRPNGPEKSIPLLIPSLAGTRHLHSELAAALLCRVRTATKQERDLTSSPLQPYCWRSSSTALEILSWTGTGRGSEDRHSRSMDKKHHQAKFKKSLILPILQQILSIIFLSIGSSHISNSQMNDDIDESTTIIMRTMQIRHKCRPIYLCWEEKQRAFPVACIIFPALVLSWEPCDRRNFPNSFSSWDRTNKK